MSRSKIHENNYGSEYELSEITVSFKELIHKIEFADVYTGDEKIPFSKKEAEFREILLSEFLT